MQRIDGGFAGTLAFWFGHSLFEKGEQLVYLGAVSGFLSSFFIWWGSARTKQILRGAITDHPGGNRTVVSQNRIRT